MSGVAVAECRNLQKKYADRLVVDNVSFDVSAGEVVVIVGPNGAGKTTTMEMLVGLRRPSSGEARILGTLVNPGGNHRVLVGVQLQQSGLPRRIRVVDAMSSAASLYLSPLDMDELLDAVGLTGRKKDFVDRLSGGQQRRLDVALACVGNAPLLVLDEPTSGLDAEGRAEIWEMLRRFSSKGKAILASTHDLAEAEAYADRVLVIRDGVVVIEGSVRDILQNAGGDWRLRILCPTDKLLDLVKNSGMAMVSAGQVTVVLGERSLIEALRQELMVAGVTEFEDIISGPVRLEDLFLLSKSLG